MKQIYKNRHKWLITGSICTLLFLHWSCDKSPDPIIWVSIPTELCIKTQHHDAPVPEINVFVKYNASEYPGYDKPKSYFDTVFVTGENGRGCMQSLPEGRHWLIASGIDYTLPYPEEVFGSMLVELKTTARPKLDTILYVTEEH